jgi:Tyrosine phosphatase family
MVLQLLGVPDDVITEEYALTTIGLKPFLPVLMERFRNQEVFKDNWDGTLSMGKSK